MSLFYIFLRVPDLHPRLQMKQTCPVYVTCYAISVGQAHDPPWCAWGKVHKSTSFVCCTSALRLNQSMRNLSPGWCVIKSTNVSSSNSTEIAQRWCSQLQLKHQLTLVFLVYSSFNMMERASPWSWTLLSTLHCVIINVIMFYNRVLPIASPQVI